MTVLNIKTSDGQNFKLDWDVARQSQTVRKMLEVLKIEEDGDGENTMNPTLEWESQRVHFQKSAGLDGRESG